MMVDKRAPNERLQLAQKLKAEWERKHPGKELPFKLKRRWLKETYGFAQWLKSHKN